MSVVIALESSFLAGGVRAQAVVVLIFAIAGELIVWRYGSRVIEVSDGRFRAGSWRLPIGQVRAVALLDEAATRRELHSGDDQVYRCTRGWVHTALLLQVDDPDDMPLWLVSTRHPHLLAAALADAAESASAAAGADPAAGSPAWTPSPGAL
jgi:hypothetical protein